MLARRFFLGEDWSASMISFWRPLLASNILLFQVIARFRESQKRK